MHAKYSTDKCKMNIEKWINCIRSNENFKTDKKIDHQATDEINCEMFKEKKST